MVGQGNPFVDQIEEEIAQAAEAKISRLERLARNADKATRKKHTSS
jgi:hypothetical protein